MCKRHLALLLAINLLCLASLPVKVEARQEGTEAARVAQVKANVAKRGTGEKALPVGATGPTSGAPQGGEPNDKLRSDISRLLADARAGRVGTTIQPRQQPAQSNNLSKKTKVTIAVVAALVVIAVVIASKADDGPGEIRIF